VTIERRSAELMAEAHEHAALIVEELTATLRETDCNRFRNLITAALVAAKTTVTKIADAETILRLGAEVAR